VSTPEKATLSSGTMATITATARAITATARTIYPYDASLDDVDARVKEQLDTAAREDFEAPGTIADALTVVARGQRRDLG
jgi:hypothetical protein